MSSLTKFPATLATKRSPIPLSNISSTGIRLSRQDRITALGGKVDLLMKDLAEIKNELVKK
jgi:hypothetical protein